MTKTLRIILCTLLLVACDSPSSPAVNTEAQVTSDTTWDSQQMGELGPMSGSGDSAVLIIGSGRQCANVRKTGSGTLTLRVGDGRAIIASSPFASARTVCGEGPLR